MAAACGADAAHRAACRRGHGRRTTGSTTIGLARARLTIASGGATVPALVRAEVVIDRVGDPVAITLDVP